MVNTSRGIGKNIYLKKEEKTMAKKLMKNYPLGIANPMPKKVVAKASTESYRSEANRGYHVNQVVPKALPIRPIPA